MKINSGFFFTAAENETKIQLNSFVEKWSVGVDPIKLKIMGKNNFYIINLAV